MSEIDASLDFFINPALNNNNTLNQILNKGSNLPLEQIESFEKVFDDISEQFNQELESISNPVEKVEDKKEKDEKPSETFLSLMGNNFGPPIGLNIEGFDYSLI